MIEPTIDFEKLELVFMQWVNEWMNKKIIQDDSQDTSKESIDEWTMCLKTKTMNILFSAINVSKFNLVWSCMIVK